jgi:hypothetical protein
MHRSEHAQDVALTSDLSRETSIPWFLWDEPMSMRELRERLQRSEDERVRLLGKILREARDEEVWLFTTPAEVDRRWSQLEGYLGRRRDFWRFLLDQWRSQGLLTVRDIAPQLFEKLKIGGITVDPAEEILANKLCTLLSRIEPRDLVDVARLEEAGHSPIAALELAKRKDGGMSASQLAWVLSTFPIPNDETSLHGMSRQELERFRDSLVARLTAAAYPQG